MAEKMSTLVLKVDFECSKCYNKVRRTLCSYHYEIRSQTNDTKQGTITVTGPFDPNSFAKKLNSKAGKAIKGIEIKKKEEDKPKEKPPAEAEKPKEKPADKPKEGKPKAADAKQDKPKEDKPAQKAGGGGGGGDKPKKGGDEGGAKQDPPKPAAAAPPPEVVKGGAEPGPQMKMIEPGTVLAYPIVQPPPYGAYSVPCYEGYVGGGPVYYDGYYERPVTSSYEGYNGYGENRGYGNGYHGNYGYDQGYNGNNGGTEYFSEKNPACIIM